jgi:UTP:GlnB (protein PII) uridylyltransferase
MGLLSWIFPSEADRLQSARTLMARGRYEDARRGLVHCTSPEAEALYEECSAAVDKADVAANQKRAHAEGFRGWKVEVTMKDEKAKAKLLAIIAREIERSGIDLSALQIDETRVQAALDRAQVKARNKGLNSPGTVKVVPLMAGAPGR